MELITYFVLRTITQMFAKMAGKRHLWSTQCNIFPINNLAHIRGKALKDAIQRESAPIGEA